MQFLTMNVFENIGYCSILGMLILFLKKLSLEEESDKKEVDGDADAKGRNHGDLLHQSQTDEEVEKEGLLRVVDDMRERESCSTLGIGFHLEGVARAGEAVEDESDDDS